MIDSSKLLTCAQFRVLRDELQALRRAQVLPSLKARKTALRAEIDTLTRKRDGGSKHDKQAVDSELRPLWVEWSYVHGQVSVIENELVTQRKAA